MAQMTPYWRSDLVRITLGESLRTRSKIRPTGFQFS
jgi:hypothetical protein